MSLKGSFSIIFQIVSAVAGFLSIWIKLTIESNVNKTLAEHKKEMEEIFERKFVQINQLKGDLSVFVTRDQHSAELNYLKAVTEKSQEIILVEIKKIVDSISSLSIKFESINIALKYENEKISTLERDLKNAISKWEK